MNTIVSDTSARERIARIINDGWGDPRLDMPSAAGANWEKSLAKADAILALLPARSEPVVDGAAEVRAEVAAFALLMERELRANDHKPGWKGDAPEALLRRVNEEAQELGELLLPGSQTTFAAWSAKVGKEAADVANMAMMVADVCGALKKGVR